MQQSLLLSAAFAAMFALVPTASALCLTPNCAPRRPAPNCARAPVHAVRAQLGGGGLGALWDGLMGGAPTEYTPLEERETSTEELEYVPLVLVVGATGRTGRVIVRKLTLQGFRVSVLVRSLATDTLNLLGSGVSYSYGDMGNYRSLLDAMEDVDKVVFAASAADGEDELAGLQNVLRAFQDTRTFMYGEAEATKLSLFKFRKPDHFNRWAIESDGADDAVAKRLAAAGMRASPSVAYWKRSPTGSHSNAVFVGHVFDPYLGSAVVSAALDPTLAEAPRLLAGGALAPAASSSAADRTLEGGGGRLTIADARALDEARVRAEAEAAAAAAAAGEAELTLHEYSGLVLKAIGDGQVYTAILRTAEYATTRVEWHADFATKEGSFVHARLPFSTFTPHRDGRPINAAAAGGELDRRAVRDIALAYFPVRNGPESVEGSFYLSLAHVKAYRRRDEPEVRRAQFWRNSGAILAQFWRNSAHFSDGAARPPRRSSSCRTEASRRSRRAPTLWGWARPSPSTRSAPPPPARRVPPPRRRRSGRCAPPKARRSPRRRARRWRRARRPRRRRWRRWRRRRLEWGSRRRCRPTTWWRRERERRRRRRRRRQWRRRWRRSRRRWRRRRWRRRRAAARR